MTWSLTPIMAYFLKLFQVERDELLDYDKLDWHKTLEDFQNAS